MIHCSNYNDPNNKLNVYTKTEKLTKFINEPIDYIIGNGLTYCEGNVVKYITRWRSKGGVDDLKKAKVYIDFIIEKEGVTKISDK